MILDTPTRARVLRGMVESRCLDERLLLLVRQGRGYFWTGGPGEEAFNCCLGAQIRCDGRGPAHDFLLPHYRSSAIALMCGERSVDFLRQMLGRDTDPYSRGRNFGNHFCNVSHNLGPVSSPVSSQFVFALGSARAQRGHASVTVTIGGDASTHAGDFASLLAWASRPHDPLPILIVVTNNGGGISTRWETQHAEQSAVERALPFRIEAASVDGLSVDDSWAAVREALAYVRERRRPFLLEARVSRLWGHSSSSGAGRDPDAEDPLDRVDLPPAWAAAIRERLKAEAERVLAEPPVTAESAATHAFGPERPWPPSLTR